MHRLFFIHLSESTDEERTTYTAHLYRRGVWEASAEGGTANNAARLAVQLYRAHKARHWSVG
jgi:hypothetical protein